MEVRGNNRSVMPLDVLGRTRATLTEPTSFFLVRKVWVIHLVKLCRAGDRALQLIIALQRGIPSQCKSSNLRWLCPGPLYTPPVATIILLIE
jgi:hypothetical protein